MSKEIRRFPRYPDWYSGFHSPEDFKNAPPLSFAIEGFLQNGAATVIAGLSGHSKTWVLLSIAKALLAGPETKLWNQFSVRDEAERVLYLIPESGITPFKHRLKKLRMYHHVEEGRLWVHTLSKGVAPDLDDKRVLKAAKGAHIFLDTVIRFSEGDENSASDNKHLSDGIFGLIEEGAKTITAAHHSPKSFASQNVMTLENMVRGSGDIGAMFATGWGIRQINPERNIIHIQNIKPRDFTPCGPFQIVGKPYIDSKGDFRMYKKPGECGTLAQELGSNRRMAGKRTTKMEKSVQRVKKLIEKDGKDITDKEIVKRFKANGWGTLGESTARKYRKLAVLQKDA